MWILDANTRMRQSLKTKHTILSFKRVVSAGSCVDGGSVSLLSDPVEVIVSLHVSEVAQTVLKIATTRRI